MKQALSIIAVIFIFALCACTVQQNAVTETATLSSTSTGTSIPSTPFQAVFLSPTPTEPIVLPTSPVGGESAVSVSTDCRRVIDQMTAYKAREDFEPNMYFNFLSHLQMEEGYQLDYYYKGNEMGGLPLVYDRKIDGPKLETLDDYMAYYEEQPDRDLTYASTAHSSDYLSRVLIDGSAESYFEFVTMALLGDQFKLFWHANYNDLRILCDVGDIDLLEVDLAESGLITDEYSLPSELIEGLHSYDLTPRVLFEEQSVTIRLVTFTKWGGFYEYIYTVEKDHPLEIMDIETNLIYEYSCGIAF